MIVPLSRRLATSAATAAPALYRLARLSLSRFYATAGAAQPQLEFDYYSSTSKDGGNRLGGAAAAMADTEGAVPSRGVQWAFIGSPRANRRVYAETLSKLLEVPCISMAGLVRQELNPRSSLYKQIANAVNRGALVPEDIIFGLLANRGETGFILDGVPRSQIQAEILDQLVEIDLVVNFKFPEDYLCHDGGAWKGKIKTFYEQSKQLEDYYLKQRKLLNFQVSVAPWETWQGLLEALHLQHINAGYSSRTDQSDEALVVCGDRSMGTGITIWDMETGDRIMHIPTCASPAHGMCCLRRQFLVASQVNKHGSVGGGAIFTWPLNKPQQPLRSYPIEAIGPLACTLDGLYLAGGSPSGNAYLWEVTSGRLLKTWRAHRKTLKCLMMVSSVCEDSGKQSSLLHYSSEHKSSITGFVTTSGSANPAFISSSLDSTCKAWDLVCGRLIQTQQYPVGIAAILLHPSEQVLYAGSLDGRIFVTVLDIGPAGDPFVVADDQSAALEGHKVSSLFRVSVLDKCSQPTTSSNGVITRLHSCSVPKAHSTYINFRSAASLDQQILEMETPAAMQMKVETNMDHRAWAIRMTNHVMEMNKHLQSRLLDLMQIRVFRTRDTDLTTAIKNKKLKIESPALEVEKVSKSPG
ncbi:hypothetical protein Tsubulata_021076 [Turnera subulata]|uniref:adenylate kinase n=1 Tax=Turnera subulata TaxID=218843 RepID=A0A9Q0FVQ9_9ROSI|nr:hypothetical protein Tsubulata_021076 [Turnera subulata]